MWPYPIAKSKVVSDILISTGLKETASQRSRRIDKFEDRYWKKRTMPPKRNRFGTPITPLRLAYRAGGANGGSVHGSDAMSGDFVSPAQAEDIVDNNFSSEAGRSSGRSITGLMSSNDIKAGGGMQLSRKVRRIPFFNWRRNPHGVNIEDFFITKIKWHEVMNVNNVDQLATTAKRGLISNGHHGRQHVFDGTGYYTTGNAASETLTNTPAQYNAGFVQLGLFNKDELASKYQKCQSHFNPLSQVPGYTGVIAPTFGTSGNGTLHIDNFEREYDITNVGNSMVLLEYYDCICIKDTSRGPLQAWEADMTTANLKLPMTGYNGTPAGPDDGGTFPLRFYKPRITSPGARPHKGNPEFHEHWRVLEKIRYLIPPGASIKIYLRGNFNISGDKLYGSTNDAQTDILPYIQHVTRIPMFFQVGQDAIVVPTAAAATNDCIGAKVPSQSAIVINMSQMGLYKSIPKFKNYAEVTSAIYWQGGATTDQSIMSITEPELRFNASAPGITTYASHFPHMTAI